MRRSYGCYRRLTAGISVATVRRLTAGISVATGGRLISATSLVATVGRLTTKRVSAATAWVDLRPGEGMLP